jgi:hypothetical protein
MVGFSYCMNLLSTVVMKEKVEATNEWHAAAGGT